LPAAVAGRLRLGDEARIMPEGFTQAIPARVSFVSPEAQFTPNSWKPPASARSSPTA
jgi:HlyD family secretion protein